MFAAGIGRGRMVMNRESSVWQNWGRCTSTGCEAPKAEERAIGRKIHFDQSPAERDKPVPGWRDFLAAQSNALECGYLQQNIFTQKLIN